MPEPRFDRPRPPVFTPKLSRDELEMLVQVADAVLERLEGKTSADSGPDEQLATYEALSAARAKLMAAREGFDLASGHHFSLDQLDELGQLGA